MRSVPGANLMTAAWWGGKLTWFVGHRSQGSCFYSQLYFWLRWMLTAHRVMS